LGSSDCGVAFFGVDANEQDAPSALARSAVVLEAGTHEYKFVTEGTRWRHDPSNGRQAGSYHNSVIELGKVR
jgi:hypothetical protein